MSKNKNSVLDGIITFAAVFGGAYLSVELLKLFAKKETYYTCDNCDCEVEKYAPICKTCKSKLKWSSLQK
jgi:hypothetical protein